MFQCLLEYFLELALLQSDFVNLKSSLIAAAATYLGRATLGIRDVNGNIWNQTLAFYTSYDVEALEDTILKLHDAHSKIHEQRLCCVAHKYKSKKFYRVALKPAPLKEDLGFH